MRTSPISQCLRLSTAEKGTKNWPIFYCPGKNVCADTCCQCCCALDCHLLWKDSCVITKNVITDINLLLFYFFDDPRYVCLLTLISQHSRHHIFLEFSFLVRDINSLKWNCFDFMKKCYILTRVVAYTLSVYTMVWGLIVIRAIW